MIGNIGGVVSPAFLGWYVDSRKTAGFEGRERWDPGFWIYVGVSLVGMLLWAAVDPRRVVESSDEKVCEDPDLG